MYEDAVCRSYSTIVYLHNGWTLYYRVNLPPPHPKSYAATLPYPRCKTINRSHAHRTHRQRKHPRHRQTSHTNTERATAQRRLIVEVVVAEKPPSAALLLSSLLPTRGTGHLPERTTRTGALRDWKGVAQECIPDPNHLNHCAVRIALAGERVPGHKCINHLWGAGARPARRSSVRRRARAPHPQARLKWTYTSEIRPLKTQTTPLLQTPQKHLKQIGRRLYRFIKKLIDSRVSS